MEHSQFLEKWLLSEAEKRNNSLGNELEYHAVCDKERHHYQLLKMGWIGNRFVFTLLFHFDIKPDGKIWVQQNNTETLLAEEWARFGILKSEIVVGFRTEHIREGSGYAVS